MKLAEALVLRADTQKRLEQIKERLLRNAKTQEGDKPAEDPAVLLKEYETAADQLTSLIQRINRTNAEAQLKDSTLSDALALRDVLSLRSNMYRDLAKAASITYGRQTVSEVRFRSTVSVAEIQKRADALSKEHRELDARIQEMDWKTDLAD
jgi:hypothetical protein